MTAPFKTGDIVQPKPEWAAPGFVPAGRVTSVVPWGGSQVIYVEGDHRGFVAEVFDWVPA